jgi:4-amino-4-deoxy-L-arabinose transferase-like glycosyltransferase
MGSEEALGAPARRWVLESPFAKGVALIAAFGLVLRLAYLFAADPVTVISGDGGYFLNGANLLAQGHGFIDVGAYLYSHRTIVVPGAEHPPGFVIALAIPSVLGLDTKLEHQVFTTLLGTGTIVLVAFAGRRLAGPRAGLVAAAVAALYPGFWLYEAQLLSETLVIFEVALVLLLALQFRARPSWPKALAVGAVCGALALTRTEMILLVPLLLLPLMLLTSGASWKQRVAWLAVAGVTAAVVIGPWVVYNLGRFDQQVLISSQGGRTLAASNCDPAYYGPLLGYKDLVSPGCSRAAAVSAYLATLPADVRSHPDGSWRDAELNKLAKRYINSHRRRLAVVIPAREGRTWGVFRPLQQLRLDLISGDIWLLWLQYFSYLAMLPFAIAGAIALRRRRMPLSPLLAVIATVAVTVAITFGSTRYRAPADVAIGLLAAVGIDALVNAWSHRRLEPDEGDEPPAPTREKKREKLLPITR